MHDAAAVRDVLAERRRQIDVEGWTPEHDDAHRDEKIALAAVCYALPEHCRSIKARVRPALPQPTLIERLWPRRSLEWKPSDRRRDLVKAGALILAEIERLDRAKARQPKGGK